jgi:hypothetical protein
MINIKEQGLSIAAIIVSTLVLLTYCNPAPAEGLRDPFSTRLPVPADPYYTQYPFQTPNQASRQLDADQRQRRNIEAITDATAEAQRRSDAAADAREFQRRLEAIK